MARAAVDGFGCRSFCLSSSMSSPLASSASRTQLRRASRLRARIAAENAIVNYKVLFAEKYPGLPPALARQAAAREAAARPALIGAVSGAGVPAQHRIRRNVALHAGALPSSSAPLSSWRAAQRGPRLQHTATAIPFVPEATHKLNIDALPFVPFCAAYFAESVLVALLTDPDGAPFPVAWDGDPALPTCSTAPTPVCS